MLIGLPQPVRQTWFGGRAMYVSSLSLYLRSCHIEALGKKNVSVDL
jgi:hypothetical protein